MSNVNVSIAAIPAYCFINLLCHLYATSLLISADKERKVYDNRNPRDASPETLRRTLGPPTYETYTRAKAAHTNGNENLPLFAAAMLAGNFAHLDQRALNIAAAAIIVMRVLYSLSYITAKSRGQSYIRSLIWMGTMGIKFYVLIKASMVTAALRGVSM